MIRKNLWMLSCEKSIYKCYKDNIGEDQKRFLPLPFAFPWPCLAGWASHRAKDFKAPTKETGADPKGKGPVTKWTQQSYPRSKQTGESVSGAAETQQDPEGMCDQGPANSFLPAA